MFMKISLNISNMIYTYITWALSPKRGVLNFTTQMGKLHKFKEFICHTSPSKPYIKVLFCLYEGRTESHEQLFFA